MTLFLNIVTSTYLIDSILNCRRKVFSSENEKLGIEIFRHTKEEGTFFLGVINGTSSLHFGFFFLIGPLGTQ